MMGCVTESISNSKPAHGSLIAGVVLRHLRRRRFRNLFDHPVEERGAIMYAPATATSLTDEMVVLLGAAGIGGQILCFF
jgi:hypothetical protein